MAFSAAIKIRSFIAEDWVDFPNSVEQYKVEFKGDNRSFTTADNVTARTRQYLTFKYSTGSGGFEFSGDTRTGTTFERLTNLFTKKVSITSDKADDNTIRHEVVSKDATKIKIKCICHSANPKMTGAPAIDYVFYITLHNTGKLELEGIHDGFPCYEVYARYNNNDWQTVYTFKEQTILSLFGEPEISVKKTKQLF
ncbi:DUF3238 domain-containing protein [Paenibacillus nicotianae]|uniref:DUF3238 domain-containing protein n=1 Tax=Paenibacillus nicotianae TaxID=1526551 RepID=A0ABW4UWD5_9BACL